MFPVSLLKSQQNDIMSMSRSDERLNHSEKLASLYDNMEMTKATTSHLPRLQLFSMVCEMEICRK